MHDYQIVGAFDTETTNFESVFSGHSAFPILYQLGILSARVEDIKPETAKNLIEVSVFRKHDELYAALDDLMGAYKAVTPVILVHNLGFDMYALAPWLVGKSTRVLAKTGTKPISIQVLDGGSKPLIVFLDTLGLFMKSLATLGEECGMPKAVGSWDYTKIRTPDTPLTDEELAYAKQDIYTLLCHMGYFLRQNPDIRPGDIGLRVQTKTGIVRAKRMVHVGNVKGKGCKTSVRQYWHLHNQSQKPKNDDELFTMHAATRGGFTFVAKNNASKVYHADDRMRITSYDSTSQHPAQMCSHLAPIDFSEAEQAELLTAFRICCNVSTDRVMRNWQKPFKYAFHGAFEFENLRPKAGSVFEREGIYPLASARATESFPVYGNQAASEFKDAIGAMGYRDRIEGAACFFGKIESADRCMLFLTELDAWIMSRCYYWDDVRAVSGYLSATFRKPSDMSILSVMRFYKAKDALKEFMACYSEGQTNDVSKIKGLYPDVFVSKCGRGDADYSELGAYYMLAKADLNSLF